MVLAFFSMYPIYYMIIYRSKDFISIIKKPVRLSKPDRFGDFYKFRREYFFYPCAYILLNGILADSGL